MDHFALILFRFPDDAKVVVTDGLGQRTACTLGEAVSRHQIFRAHTGFDYALRTRGCWDCLGLRVALVEFGVGPWTVRYDPPPIPARNCDWQFTHADFDASYEGVENGWAGNGLSGAAASPDACLREIADIEEDRGLPRTLEAA